MKFSYTTDRLSLKILDDAFAQPVLAFFEDNREFFTPYEPDQPEQFYTLDYQEKLLQAEYKLALNGSSVRFWIFIKNHPEQIIGTMCFSHIQPMPFCCCELGYKLDARYLHQGFATEAIKKGLELMFQEFSLHRIQARVLPTNLPSIRLLERLNFQAEGVCRECVFLNKQWKDHFSYSLMSTEFY